ncbi:Glycogen synthase [compost metagenome]
MSEECQIPAIWFPAIRVGSGTDVFTRRLCEDLRARGIRADITWLPHRAEYLPWTVPVPKPPAWANVVHVNTWLHPRFIPRHLPVVATLHHSVHDPALRPYKGWLRAAYHRWWIASVERRMMRRADQVVAVSQFSADMARKTLCDVPMRVIHNGIDTDHFRPAERRSEPHRPFRLLYVGSWMVRKGVDLLAPIMRSLGGDFVLHYTGGPIAEKDKPTMPPNMIDIGRLSGDEVVAAMQQADAFLFPSRSEGLPLALMEAMACGLPVIVADAASLPEVVDEGVTGMLCPRDDVGAFATAARRLVSDAELARSMSAAAFATAAQHFDLAVMVGAYQRIYHAVIKKP